MTEWGTNDSSSCNQHDDRKVGMMVALSHPQDRLPRRNLMAKWAAGERSAPHPHYSTHRWRCQYLFVDIDKDGGIAPLAWLLTPKAKRRCTIRVQERAGCTFFVRQPKKHINSHKSISLHRYICPIAQFLLNRSGTTLAYSKSMPNKC